MKNLKYLVIICAVTVAFMACTPDDSPTRVPDRDRLEVDLEDQLELKTFLETHFWNYEEYASNPVGEDFEIIFNEIDAANAGKIPLYQQVTESQLIRSGVSYKIYTLNVRQGQGPKLPTFADSALVSYKGMLLDKKEDGTQTIFDSSINAVWFDLPNVVSGFMEGVSQFNGAATITPQPDGTFSFDNSGIGAVFMPSGVGYFASGPSGIPAYAPLIFTFHLRSVRTTDHDGDGIYSQFEDLNGDRNLRSELGADNTDGDFFTSGQSRIVGHNFIDADDDNDGVLTKDEDPDPNGDGNPDDARDTDGDGIPDYLDADTAI